MTRRPPSRILGLALLLAACESGVPTGPITSLPRELTPAEQEVVAASNDFAFGLFREVAAAAPDSNVFLSPLSASMALGMTMNGARGETFDVMRSTLGFDGLTQHEINASYRSLIDLLRGIDPGVEMLIGNSIWYRNDFPFEPAFFDTTRVYFDAEVAGLDFADPASVDVINAWVNESTKGKIPTIMEEIDPDDVMYLINAIYYKGDWRTQFDPSDTRDAPFFDSTGEQVRATVNMMHRDGPIRYLRGGDFQAAELLYGRGAFSMVLVLPDPGRDVDALIDSLDADDWRALTDGLEEAEIGISMPKFRMEYERSLKDALTALGMGQVFNVADFTGMSPRGEELVITKVFQKSFVNVDEEGTEAAAATNVGVGETSAPAEMRVDRPFVFAIRERFSGAILFIGKLEVPPPE